MAATVRHKSPQEGCLFKSQSGPTSTSLSEALQVEFAIARGRTPIVEEDNVETESDLKYFHTSKQGKVSFKQLDLVDADKRRRQAKFLMDNPTFKMRPPRLSGKASAALTDLAKNSLYFKSNTIRSGGKSTGRSKGTLRS